MDHRQQLRRAMRLDLPPVYASPRVETVQTWDGGDPRVELIAVETEEDFWLPAYVMEPRGRHEGRTLIALHGQGRGALDVVGPHLRPGAGQDLSEAASYGGVWAKAGFVVVVPELRGFGRLMLSDDRDSLDRPAEPPSSRNSASRLMAIYLQLGRTYAGCCVADLIRLIDHLESRQGVDADRIGIGGIGEGARVLSWLVALEDRIIASSAWIPARDESPTRAENGLESPPMIGTLGLVDPVSMLACYVPKPLYLQAGRPETVGGAGRGRSAVDRLGRLYRLCGAEDRFVLDTEDGAPRLDHDKIVEFFGQWL